MPSYTPLPIVYATDEDISLRATSDFDKLVPNDQKLAAGIDGVLAAGLWTLTAASVTDWGAMGVKPGMIVQLEVPVVVPGVVQYRPRELLCVDSIATATLTLRRKGMASGVGLPPGPASAARYLISTLAPQIEDVCYELNRRFGVDPSIPGRTPTQFYDVREVNQLATLTVLARQYKDMARAAGKDAVDTLWAKHKSTKCEADEVLSRLVIHWQSVTGWGVAPIEPTTTRFSTRISR